jgi:hypothetical protein
MSRNVHTERFISASLAPLGALLLRLDLLLRPART